MANTINIPIQSPRNNSLSKMCNCNTKSEFDKNFNAKASSKNPNTTLTVFNHPPDEGKEFNHPGNAANNPNGNANANENPNMATIGPESPPDADCTNTLPTIGPVHEKDTNANVNAMKKIPIIPPLSACLSALFTHDAGNVISNAPKKEIANTTNKMKNTRFTHGFVAMSFSIVGPAIAATSTPSIT